MIESRWDNLQSGTFQLFKLSKLCYHLLSSFKNENVFFDIPSNPPPIAVRYLLTNQFFKKKLQFCILKKNVKLKRREGLFQLFKLSKICHHFLSSFENRIYFFWYPYQSSAHRGQEFIDQSIFPKKIEVSVYFQHQKKSDKFL